jgi:hypothetical protein
MVAVVPAHSPSAGFLAFVAAAAVALIGLAWWATHHDKK